MALSSFSFGIEQFNKLFHFYILIDENLNVCSFGKSLAKIIQLKSGQPFTDYFKITRPKLNTINFSNLLALKNNIVLINIIDSNDNILRGQIEYLEEENKLLFIGTPWFSSMEDLEKNNLTLNDFAKHDSVIDQLNILKAQEIATNDIKNLLQVTNEQKKAIKYSEHLWKFALEGNGDGIWQYDLKNEEVPSFPPYKKALGYEIDDEFTIQQWHDSIHTDDLEKVNNAFDEYINGETAQLIVEHRLLHKSGKYKYFVVRGIIVEWDERGKPCLVIGTITDVDQQKQLEIQLKETNNRLSYLIQNLHSGVIVENKERKILLINEKFCDIFGITIPVNQLIGMGFANATKQSKSLFANPENFVERVEEILEKKQIVLHEKLQLTDGRFFERDYVPIFMDGKYEGHLWNFEDITERVIADNKLEEQRKFYENVLNNIPADIVAFNPNHDYLFINPTAIKDAELRKWMIGKNDAEYCLRRGKSTEIINNRKLQFEKVVASKKIYFWEDKITKRDGSTAYILRHLYPVLNEQNEVIQVIAYGLDITDRKKIEEQLKINEKRYRDLFNYSQAYICTHDLNGILITTNPAICEKLGYTSSEMIGRNISDFIPKADLPNFQTDYLDKVINKGIAKGVFRVIGKTDKKSFLLYQNFKVEEENSEPYIIGFSQDITERIQIEKELRKAKKITEESAKAKELFLANMSHEIRTPMSGILGIANLLSKTNLNEQQRKYTNLITGSANGLLTIVNDVLDIEKIASGKFELESIPFRLEEKVLTTVHSFQYKAEEKNILLTFKNNISEDIIVKGDPSRLGQILNNLMSNALKFTNRGTIEIAISCTKNEKDSITVLFEVSDSGIGINPEKLNEIFNPYVQATSDTSRKFGGTGLGLSICKNLIEMQGGKITVNSKLNVGTTFSFYIPYKKGERTSIPENNQSNYNFLSLKNSKILVAEDVELNQFLISQILQSWGCSIVIVNNGKDALDEFITTEFDIILMDIHMPVMDGITATKKIRNLKNYKSKVPIIALTANALKGDHQNYINAGMDDCVTKPYTEEKLYEVINKVLNKPNLYIIEDNIIKKNTESTSKEIANDTKELLYDLTFVNSFGRGDVSFAKKMVGIFLDSVPKDLIALQNAIDTKDTLLIRNAAHKMKSQIDSMGILSVQQNIRDIETNKYENDEQLLLTWFLKLQTILNEVFIQLNEYMEHK